MSTYQDLPTKCHYLLGKVQKRTWISMTEAQRHEVNRIMDTEGGNASTVIARVLKGV